jgi:hypothetical protein
MKTKISLLVISFATILLTSQLSFGETDTTVCKGSGVKCKVVYNGINITLLNSEKGKSDAAVTIVITPEK